jgi:ABC-type transport system involved in multi-copper enzyme maturation permease subunit
VSARRFLLVAREELAFNVRRPMFYILLAVVALLVWGLSSGNVQIVIASGDASVGGKKAYLTSEFALAQIISAITFTLHVFFFAAAAGMSVIRDGESKVGEILHATPLTPGEYVWGKFIAGLVTFALVVLAQLALTALIFQVIPNADMLETRGPFALANYLRPALYLTLPMVLFLAGVSFAIGTWSRRAILVFLLPVILVLLGGFFLWSWSPSWLPEWVNRLLQWVDPSGVRWLRETWLKVDRGADFYNTQPIAYDTPFVLSRIAFAAAGLGAVALTASHFAATLRSSGRVKTKRTSVLARRRAAAAPLAVSTADGGQLTALASLGMRSRVPGFLRATLAIARAESKELRSQAGLYLFVPVILLQTLGSSLTQLGAFDTPLLLTPGTLAVAQLNYLTALVSLLLIFYAVETLERERATGFAAIHRALPMRTGALLAGKALALAVVGAVIVAACLLACWIALLVQGRVSFSLVPFALVWGALLIPSFLLWTAFVMAGYAVTRNRYSAYAVAILAFGATVYLSLTQRMNWLGNWPLWGAVQWSDLSILEKDRAALVLNRVFALGLAGTFWMVAVKVFPRRDRDAIRTMHAFRPVALWRSAMRALPALAIPLVAGAFLWRQVSEGPGGAHAEKQQKDYWRKNLATWRDAPIPALARADLDVGIEPAKRAWTVKGSYLVVNKSAAPMSQLPVSIGLGWHDIVWSLDGAPAKPDTASLLRVFTLARPLAPGDSVRLGFAYAGAQRGSTKNGDGAGEFILPSGVVMTSFGPRWFPLVGYVEDIGVDEKNRYEPRQYPQDFWEGVTEPLFGSALPMTTRISITTPADFTANSVGERVDDRVHGASRTVTWRSDRPVMAFNIVAGRYQVRRGQGTALYYDPAHTYNVAEMGEALDAARKYYGEWFGDFRWKELKVSEFPAMATYAQGFPTNITFSESIGFLTKSEPKTNLAFLVTAHESAHQWWGNMLQPGRGPSANLLSEGMAHFSTALLIEQVKGFRDGLEFRERIESRYGDQRRADAERKLLRVDGSKQGDNTVTYDKGGWVFWMLAHRMGRDDALRGMRDFIAKYDGNPDHPVLHDFVVHMRAYARDTAAYDDFARQWFDSVVVPEYRVRDARTAKQGDAWVTTATIENVGTGRMPVEVAATVGERFPADTAKARASKAGPYRDARTTITLDGKQHATVTIRSAFRPEKVVVDPDVTVLQLRRKSAEGVVKG